MTSDVGPVVLGVFALVMAIGLIGTVVPVLPGLALIWATGLVYGIVAGFGATGWTAFAVMTVLLVVGTTAQLVLPSRAGARGGAPRSTLMAGALGGLVGFFAIPVVGLPIGAVLAVLAAEQRRLGDLQRAWATTRGVIVGFGVGLLVELSAGLVMVATWIGWVLLTR